MKAIRIHRQGGWGVGGFGDWHNKSPEVAALAKSMRRGDTHRRPVPTRPL